METPLLYGIRVLNVRLIYPAGGGGQSSMVQEAKPAKTLHSALLLLHGN